MMLPYIGNAQQSYLFSRNHPENLQEHSAIELKWFSKDIFNSEGFNIYRRTPGNASWKKLNPSPIIKKSGIPQNVLAQDDELTFFVEVANSPEDLEREPVLQLNLLLKSFESTPFADFLGIYWIDYDVQSGYSYEYRVTQLASGNEINIGTTSIVAGPYQKDASVEGVEVYQQRKIVEINWEQQPERFYAVNIYYQQEGGERIKANNEPVMLSMVPDSVGNLVYPNPMYKLGGLEEQTSYQVTLEGVDYFGATTELSDPITLTLDDVTPPDMPKGLEGVADTLEVKLQWENPKAPDLKGVNVLRSRFSEGPFEQVNKDLLGVDIQTYQEKLSIPGPYYYKIEALDHANNVSHSNRAFVDVQDVIPPNKPSGLTITSDTGRFVLQWKANIEPDLQGYLLFRTVDADTPGEYLLLTADPLDTNFFEQQLPENVKNEFYYYVVAVDTSFNRSPPSDFATAVLPDVTPPEQPFIEQITYTAEGVVVHWTSNVEPDLAGYHIYRSDSSQQNFIQVNQRLLPSYSFRYIDRSAEANEDYFYRLSAVDSTGNESNYSVPAFARNQVLEPVEASLELSLKTKKRKKINKLQWNELKVPVKGYIVYRGTTERSIKPISGIIKNQTEYTDHVKKGDAYFYQVRAYTPSGEVIYSQKHPFNTN
ncbi:fibronectin type III domain-containing protein [Marinoscillum furvescens]|nr:hypothetical protein [Marinoscillum furvescens]